ncbi:HNH endonuclease signature motif containing protein [Quadrisphaera sp. INWT6]|uniref:HNH endonuclease signature motif containing protein n=1 Tax=Quadrisphaera sp. INWT6 TaxID=2596917 RepID=UPI001892567A|nr:HNH endonuclease signature motif containing protein [Quadrisphaera sp. INWT6]
MIDAGVLGGAVPTHPVLCAPALIAEAAASLLASSGASLSLAELQGAYLALHRAEAAVAAAALHVVRMLVEHERPQRRKAESTQTKAWLERAALLGSGDASRLVAAARATDPDRGALRGLGAALAEGEVSRAHVDVAVKLLPRVPQRVLEERREDVDEHLTEKAREFCPSDADTLAKHLRRALTGGPGGLDGDDWPEPPAASFERRQCSWHVDAFGMTQVRASLPQAEAAPVTALLGALSAPTRPDPDGPGADAPDERTTTQRRADAFTEVFRRAQGHDGGAEHEVGRLVVVATEAQLADEPGAGGATTTHDATPLSPTALQRHACDAVVDRVVLDRRGAVVRMESVGRLANRAQRRALAARDGGCAFPGCGAPATWCEAHHVVFWSQGGATELSNLVLLCSRHRTEIHLGHWTITVRDAVPWFVPPPWVDRERTPVRNSLHQRITETRSFAADLRRPTRGSPDDADEAA